MSSKNTMTPVAAQAPVAATDAVLTMAAPTDNSRWTINWIGYSYSAVPTGGKVVITWNDGTDRAMTFYITAGGPGLLNFISNPLIFPSNTAVTITLVSGAGAVIGTIYAGAYTS